MVPVLYGASLSPFVRKVRVVLAECQLPYEQESIVPINVSEAFKKISPLGKIPAYREGDFTLADSSVICNYLNETQKANLYPSDPKQKAKALWFEEYADSAFIPAIVSNLFFQKILRPALFGEKPDAALIEKTLTQTLPPMFNYLEQQLLDGRKFLVADQFSIADIAISSAFVNFMLSGYEVDKTHWPKLTSYVQQIFARKVMQEIIEADKGFVKGLANRH